MKDIDKEVDESASLLENDTVSEAKRSRASTWLFTVIIGMFIQGPLTTEAPIPIMTQMRSEPFNYSYLQYNMLFSISLLAGALAPFLLVFLLKKIQTRSTKILIAVVVWIGQLLFTIGLSLRQISLMYLGRFLIGFFETLLGLLYFEFAYLFPTNQLSISIEVVIIIAKIGNGINLALSPYIYSITRNIISPSIFALALSFIGVFLILLVGSFDESSEEPRVSIQEKQERQEVSSQGTFESLKQKLWSSAFIIILITSSLNCTYFQSNDLIYERFGFSNIVSGVLSLILIASGIVVYRLCGRRRSKYPLIASITLAAGHSVFAFLPNYENNGFIVILPLILAGVSYSGFEFELWGSLFASDSSETKRSISWAIFMQKIVLSFALIGIGIIQDRTVAQKEGYYWSEFTLMIIAGVAVIFSGISYLRDKKQEEKELMLKD